MIFTIVIVLVVLLLIYFKFIIPYFKGRSFEVWYKVALICIYKKLEKEISDEKLRKAVLNLILSNSTSEKDEKIRKFSEDNADLIHKKTGELISSDSEFKNFLEQTLFVQLGMSVGYSNPEMREKIFNNPIFCSFLNSKESRPYNYHEYAKLVEKFAEKEGITTNN